MVVINCQSGLDQNEMAVTSGSEHCVKMDDEFPVYLIRNKATRRRSSFRSRIRRFGWFPHRLVQKNGHFQVRPSSSVRPFLTSVYIHDVANTLINSSWKWTLVAVSLAFLLSWFTFACIWMMIAINNGDLEENNGTAGPCLAGIQGFAGYLMFSIETQSTIGYGNRYITHHCAEAVWVLCVQITTGVFISGVLVGIVYEKISGPGRINSMNSFSKCATICQRDGDLCLIFRVRDRDRRYQWHNEIKAYLVQRRSDEPLLNCIKLEPSGILMWPVEVVHRITESSPLWDLSARDLIMKRLEIIVTMEGTCLSTMNPSSTTTSYLSKEILWGHTFVPCVQYDQELNCYLVNHKHFNRTKEIVTPLCSAKRLKEVIVDIFYNSSGSAVTSSPKFSGSTLTSSPKFSDSTAGDGGSKENSTLSPVTVHTISIESDNGSVSELKTYESDSGETIGGGDKKKLLTKLSDSTVLSPVTVHALSVESDNSSVEELKESSESDTDEAIGCHIKTNLPTFWKEDKTRMYQQLKPYHETSF